MALSDHPLLSEVLAEVRDIIDQQDDDQSVPQWSRAQQVRTARRVIRSLWERATSLDREWGTKEATATVTAGSTDVTLSVVAPDLVAVRSVWEVDGSGDAVCEYEVGEWEDIDWADSRRYIYLPRDKKLRLARRPSAAASLKVIYLPACPPVFHGYAQGSTDSTITLEDHEPPVNDTLNDLTMHLWTGVGKGQSETIADYVGGTRVATMDDDWTTNPTTTTGYTCEVPLPVEAAPALAYGIAAELLHAVNDGRYPAIEARYREYLSNFETALSGRQRHDPKITRDDCGFLDYSDPAWSR